MRTRTFRFLQDNRRYLRHLLPAGLRHRLKVVLYEALVPNPMVVRGITLWRHPIEADPDRARVILGAYEAATTRRLLSVLKEGMRFVDVGAHIGYFTILAAKAVGNTGRVWAFEPLPSTYGLLVRNIAENRVEDRVEAVRKAVTDTVGHTLFFPHSLVGRSGIFARLGMRVHDGIQVETTSLDAFFEKIGWPRVDVMKMDIEGAELMAMRGMRELAQRNAQLALVIECNPITMQAAGITAEEYLSVLGAIGFQSVRVMDVAENLSNLFCVRESDNRSGSS